MISNENNQESRASTDGLDLSIIIPCYCSGPWIEELVNEIIADLLSSEITYEIILVNDCSPDDGFTERKLKELSVIDNINTINLRFNTGQHRAICCGLDYSSGSRVIIMDDDFQCNPSQVVALYSSLDDGKFDVSIGTYDKSQSFFRRFGGLFVGILLRSGLQVPRGKSMSSFVCITRETAVSMRQFGQANPILSNLVFKSTPLGRIRWTEIESGRRKYGKSGYNFPRLINSTIDNLVSVTNRPMRAFTILGGSVFLLSIFASIWLIYQRLLIGSPPPGYTSLATSIFFFGGISVMGVGMLGEYVGRVLYETGASPLYLVRDHSFDD